MFKMTVDIQWWLTSESLPYNCIVHKCTTDLSKSDSVLMHAVDHLD